MNDHRENLLKERPDDDKKIARQFNFMVSIYDILLYIVSASGLMFIILNIKDIVVAMFTKKKKINMLTLLTFFNLSYVSAVYFVYEGQPRYNFIVLFLLIISFATMLATYQEHKKIE